MASLYNSTMANRCVLSLFRQQFITQTVLVDRLEVSLEHGRASVVVFSICTFVLIMCAVFELLHYMIVFVVIKCLCIL